MFFWYPHATFDFWHHHSRHKHHDLPPPPPPSSSESAATPYAASVYEVSLDAEENPQELSLLRRWLAVLCISSASICVTCASSMAAFVELPVARRFHVSKEVAILGVSLFVLGLGLGPLVAGPMSEIYGRNVVYRVSFSLFFICMFPVAFAPHISVYLTFRFICGYCGSAFLSVAGGSVSDMFSNSEVATWVMTVMADGGLHNMPVYGARAGTNTRWFYQPTSPLEMDILHSFDLVISPSLSTDYCKVVPETYIPVILKMKAERLRSDTGDPNWYAPMEKTEQTSRTRTLLVKYYKPFFLVLLDHMALLLNLWDSLVLGILYLTFQAFPIIFQEKHGFNLQSTGLAFLGIAIGMLLGLCTMPYWNRKYRRYKEMHGGDPPAEFRLLMGQVGGVLVPLALFALAFSTYHSVPWIVPVLASVPFGTGTYFIFTSSFTYIVVAYRPLAASALACNTTMRTAFAAAFPLFAGQMYRALGTVGATLLLAGLTTAMAPLPFVLYHMGHRIRESEIP